MLPTEDVHAKMPLQLARVPGAREASGDAPVAHQASSLRVILLHECQFGRREPARVEPDLFQQPAVELIERSGQHFDQQQSRSHPRRQEPMQVDQLQKREAARQPEVEDQGSRAGAGWGSKIFGGPGSRLSAARGRNSHGRPGSLRTCASCRASGPADGRAPAPGRPAGGEAGRQREGRAPRPGGGQRRSRARAGRPRSRSRTTAALPTAVASATGAPWRPRAPLKAG